MSIFVVVVDFVVVVVAFVAVLCASQNVSELTRELISVVSPHVDVDVGVSVVVVDNGIYAGLHFGLSTLVTLAQYFVQRSVR